MEQEIVKTGQPEPMLPMALLEKAVVGGADTDTLERLMGLQERWEANNARKAFTAALSAVRNEMPRIVKSKEVDFRTTGGRTNYKYEDLADLVDALSPVLGRHGLSFRWSTDSTAAGMVSVTFILEHSEGHRETTTLAGPYDQSGNKNPIQAIGSVVAYLQRYTLKAGIGIAASSDDDGRQGAPQGSPAQSPDPPDSPPTPSGRVFATQGQVELIEKLSRSHLLTDAEKETISDALRRGLTKQGAAEFIERLKAKLDTRRKEESEQDAESAPISNDQGEPTTEPGPNLENGAGETEPPSNHWFWGSEWAATVGDWESNSDTPLGAELWGFISRSALDAGLSRVYLSAHIVSDLQKRGHAEPKEKDFENLLTLGDVGNLVGWIDSKRKR
jgi:hypothetical protein